MRKKYSTIWAGTSQAFDDYLNILGQIERQAAGKVLHSGADSGDDPTEECESSSYLLSVADGVALVSIKGVLTNEDKWYNQYFGLVSYNEIRTALYQALQNPQVATILLDVSSPGGAIYGLLDAVNAVAAADKVKPVHAYSDSVAASAGFWLIAPARTRSLSPVATMGSIGVVAKHTEYSKLDEKEGITRTVIRSGAYKMLANDIEPLSTKALEVLQGQVDYLDDVFTESVAGFLGTTQALVRSKMGQGKEFIGSQAVEAGLADSVASFDDVYSAALKRAAKVGGTPQGGIDMKKKYAITAAAALAATAAGIVPEVTQKEEAPVAPESVLDSPEAAGNEVETETESTPATDATLVEGASALSTTPSDDSAVVSLLKAQLAEKDEALLQARMDLSNLKASTEGLEALKAIVAQSINTMLVGMNGASDDTLATASATSLLAQHTSVQKRFTDWWAGVTPGGVASSAATEDTSEPEAKAPALSRRENAVLNSAKVLPMRSR